jgi:hypothetical protein
MRSRRPGTGWPDRTRIGIAVPTPPPALDKPRPVVSVSLKKELTTTALTVVSKGTTTWSTRPVESFTLCPATWKVSLFVVIPIRRCAPKLFPSCFSRSWPASSIRIGTAAPFLRTTHLTQHFRTIFGMDSQRCRAADSRPDDISNGEIDSNKANSRRQEKCNLSTQEKNTTA